MNTCQICGWPFTTKGNLYQHVRQVHNREKNYKCKEANCGKEFSRYNDMMKHYHAVHWFRPVRRRSRGERDVENVLRVNGVRVIREKTFEKLVGLGGGQLRYDFAVPVGGNSFLLIEYDGKQHFVPTQWSEKMTQEEVVSRFERLQKHDQIKSKYAESNGYPLLRIPYWKRYEIYPIVTEFLKNNHVKNDCQQLRLDKMVGDLRLRYVSLVYF